MFGFDHNPPHIHVQYGEYKFTITLEERIVKGSAPSSVIQEVNEFMDSHMSELKDLWEKASKGEKSTESNINMDILSVKNVKYLGTYILLCTFSTGVVKKVDLAPLLKYPAYEDLKDLNQFKQFGLDDTIFWANGADISPEWLYENGQEI